MASGEHFAKGEDVKAAGRDAVVHDKTRGDSTVVKYPDGSTELIANKAIRKEK